MHATFLTTESVVCYGKNGLTYLNILYNWFSQRYHKYIKGLYGTNCSVNRLYVILHRLSNKWPGSHLYCTPPSSTANATASLENSSICSKLNSSEMSIRLKFIDHDNKHKTTLKEKRTRSLNGCSCSSSQTHSL